MFSSPTFSAFTNTGVLTVPVGARAFSINILSGQATVNAIVVPQGWTQSWYSPDAKVILGASISVGATGLGNRATLFYSN